MQVLHLGQPVIETPAQATCSFKESLTKTLVERRDDVTDKIARHSETRRTIRRGDRLVRGPCPDRALKVVGPIATDGEVLHLLYQSAMLSVQQRPAIPLFGAPVADQDAEDILTLCAICARLAWPTGAPSGAREWIEPAEYYRRDGAEVALISHGFCEECFSRLKEED